MVWIEPRSVTLMDAGLTGVRAISVNAHAGEVLEEHASGGRYAVFVDAAEVTIELVIDCEILDGTVDIGAEIVPGAMGELRFTSAISSSSAHRETFACDVVVTSVKHALQGGSGPARRITLRGVSADGVAHPLTRLDPEGD